MDDSGDTVPQMGENQRDVESQFLLMVLNLVLLIQSIIKVFFLTRVFENLGQLVQLVIQVLNDVIQFTLFYIYFLFYFFLMFLVSGYGVDNEDYASLQPLTYTWIQVFRNSIGDANPPGIDYWDQFAESSPSLRNVGVLVIWFIWFAELFFMLIILLNFLIAIIGQSYESIMSTAVNNKCIHRAELNKEYSIMVHQLYKIFKLPFGIGFTLVGVDPGTVIDSEDWMGIITGVKRYVKAEIRQSMKEISRVNHGMKGLEQRIESKLDTFGSQIQTLEINLGHELEEIKKALIK